MGLGDEGFLLFWQSRVMRGAYWESTNVEHPGFIMGKVWQISADFDGFHCTDDDSYSGIDPFKNSSNATPIDGCIKSCRNYCRSEVSMGEAKQNNSQKPGTAELAIVTEGLNAPAYLNGVRWIVDVINPTATITVRAAETIKIGGKPWWTRHVSHLWTPNRHAPLSPSITIINSLVTYTHCAWAGGIFFPVDIQELQSISEFSNVTQK